MQSNQWKQLQHRTDKCISTMMKPLRIFQFFAVLLLFAFVIYMVAMYPTPISTLACILLITLSGVYVFVLVVELISQFAGGAVHIPMFVFSLLGVLFFGVAGILLICNGYTELAVQIGTLTLCLLAALIFLIDVTMVLAFWKRIYSICKYCCENGVVEILPEIQQFKKTDVEIMKREDATSVSDVRLSLGLEDIALTDHYCRKLQRPRRREYVDCSTCVPSLCNLEVAQIQTEPKKISVVQSQTPKTVTKETPIQTLSKCELCQRQLQPFAEGTAPQCFQHPSQWATCHPAIVQFVRGGISVPCCPGCKCATEATQQQQQQQSQQVSRQLTPERINWLEQRPSERFTSEATQQVTNSANPTSTNITTRLTGLIEPAEKISTTPKKKNPMLENISVVDEKVSTDREKREEKLVEIGEYNDQRVKRNKGGGEERTMSWQRSAHAIEQEESMTNVNELSGHSTIMQASDTPITPSTSETKSRTFMHLRSNKVDPIDDINAFDESRVKEEHEVLETTYVNSAIQKNETLESSKPIEHQVKKVCSYCKRQKMPTSDNSRYYSVFKDKRGRYFCEFCALPDCKRIANRIEVADMKRLRCTNCRSSLRGRGINILPKSDACPKCGQSQRYIDPPSSM